MSEAIKLAIVFLSVVVGIRLKIFVGYILFGAGLLTALLFRLDFGTIIDGYRDTVLSADFIYLLAIIILITFLGRILREIGYLDRLGLAGENLIGGTRTAAAVLPALVGLMPMPGGALLSAPLVDKVLHDEKYSAEFKTVVNYWSRHVVEFFWPVYPGLVLVAALTSMSIGSVSLMLMPMSFLMILTGFVFLVRRIKNSHRERGRLLRPTISILALVWPILLGIGISLLFSLKLLYAFAIALLVLLVKERPSRAKIMIAGREAVSYRLVVLVFGVLSFQKMLELGGAVAAITSLSAGLGLPDAIVIILVSFTSGLLTGILFALVGLGFPLLAGFLYQPEINQANIFLAFISGYVGMILSPSHFCLILTNEYFKSNIGAVYRLLAFPIITLFLAGLLLFLTGYPWTI
jgi:integral membrane protein (TIGR00529 family)